MYYYTLNGKSKSRWVGALTDVQDQASENFGLVSGMHLSMQVKARKDKRRTCNSVKWSWLPILCLNQQRTERSCITYLTYQEDYKVGNGEEWTREKKCREYLGAECQSCNHLHHTLCIYKRWKDFTGNLNKMKRRLWRKRKRFLDLKAATCQKDGKYILWQTQQRGTDVTMTLDVPCMKLGSYCDEFLVHDE